MRILVFLLAMTLGVTAQTVINGSRVILGDWDASGATATRPAKTGTALPGTCTIGMVLFKTDAAAGQNLYFCTSSNTWTQQSGGGGGGGSTVYGSASAIGYFVPFGTGTATGVGVASALVVRYIQFSMPAQGQFNEIIYGRTTGGTNSCGSGTDPCTLAFAIYDSTGNLIPNSTAIDTGITGTGADKVTMAGLITMPAGTYYLAMATDSLVLSLAGTALTVLGNPYLNQGLGSTNYKVFTDNSARATIPSAGVITMPSTIDSTRAAWVIPAHPSVVLSRL
jgi:hypothetical protein